MSQFGVDRGCFFGNALNAAEETFGKEDSKAVYLGRVRERDHIAFTNGWRTKFSPAPHHWEFRSRNCLNELGFSCVQLFCNRFQPLENETSPIEINCCTSEQNSSPMN